MFTLENSLKLAIGTGDIPADRTFLTGVTSVNILDAYSSCIRFIGEKLLKLKEIPFVQVLPLFFAKPHVLSNASQFFKSNHVSAIKRFHDSLCNHMVSIGSETVLLLGNLLKVSFGRFTATELQYASNFLITLGNFFNMASAKELILGSNSDLLDTPIDTYNLASGFGVGDIFTKNYVQENLIPSDKQLSRTSLPCKILSGIFRHGYRDFNSSVDGKQRKFILVKPDIVTSGIIPNRRLFRLWASCFLLFLNSCLNCLNSFSGFHASRNSKLRGKISSRVGIGFVVQRHAVRIAIIPTCLTHEVECLCVCLNGWFDNFCRNIKLKFHCAYQFHVHIISALNVNINKKNAEASRLKTGVSASLLPKER